MAAPRLIALAVAGLLCACGQATAPEVSQVNRTYPDQASAPAPVTDPSAPTVADLRRRGLERVDDEPASGPDCGPDCVTDAFSAIYMGPRTSGGPPDRRFICPGMSGEMDTWRCRPVPETARWGGAGPPPQPEGRQKAAPGH